AGKRLGRVELDERDLEAVERGCTALMRISPLVRQASATLHYGRDELSIPLEGVSAEYHAIRNFSVESGRPFAAVDVERGHHVCVVGREVLRKLNVDEGLVGQTLL